MDSQLKHIVKFAKTPIVISRRSTVIARALAILMIMMHNLFHVFPRVLTECEFDFYPELNSGFFACLSKDNPLLIYDLFSFIGWYGVPVFIFLSGFGLAGKYTSFPNFKPWDFLKRNWLKLFYLMLPAVLFFLIEESVHALACGHLPSRGLIIRTLIPLTELNGFMECVYSTVPGVYWYLGLAFELYIVYAVFVHNRPKWWIWTLTALCYASVVFFIYHPVSFPFGGRMDMVHYLRHNFVGWLLPFACGLALGRSGRIPLYQCILLLILSLLLFFPLLKSPVGWQAAALPAIVIIMYAALLIDKIIIIGNIFFQIGKLSSFIYIIHPVVRHIFGRYFFDLYSPEALPTPTLIYSYITSIFIGALLYRPLSRLTSRIIKKIIVRSKLTKFLQQ